MDNADLPEPPLPTPTYIVSSIEDGDILRRVLSIAVQGSAVFYVIDATSGRGARRTRQRVFARSDAAGLLKQLGELKSNNFPDVNLFCAHVNSLQQYYLFLNLDLIQKFTSSLRNALRPPNAPPGFDCCAFISNGKVSNCCTIISSDDVAVRCNSRYCITLSSNISWAR